MRSVAQVSVIAFAMLLSTIVWCPITEKASAYSVHSSITISNDSEFTFENGVITGNGSDVEPYVIAGWDIQVFTDAAISITGTNAHFVIMDCLLRSTMYYSVILSDANNGSIFNVTIPNGYYGLYAAHCQNLIISGCSISDSIRQGILLVGCEGSEVVGNSLVRNQMYGLTMVNQNGTVVYDNSFTDDGIDLWGDSIVQLDSHAISSNNSVNGKPIYYLVGQSGVSISSMPVGELILVSCNDVSISSIEFEGSETAVLSAWCQDVNITDCTVKNASYSLRFWHSDRCRISRNTMTNSSNNHMNLPDPGMGIVAHYCSDFAIEDNTILDSDFGMTLGPISDLTIARNNISGGRYASAIDFGDCLDVLVADNNLSDKDMAMSFGNSVNCTIARNNMTGNSNEAMYVANVTGLILEGNTAAFNGFGLRLTEVYGAGLANNTVIGGRSYTNFGFYGIDVKTGSNVSVRNNTIVDIPDGGLKIDSVQGAVVSGNVIGSNFNDAIRTFYSSDVEILNNHLGGNGGNGVFEVGNSGTFRIIGNVITSNNDSGILIWHGAEIVGNDISYNQWFGVGLNDSGSVIHHNNFIGNLIQAYDDAATPNSWDAGYPDGGNYWSNYNGTDNMNGPGQNISGSDGIGDTPKSVPYGKQDDYPLIQPIEVDRPPVAFIEASTLSGDTTTVFEFNASASWDFETPTNELMYRWDWDGDGNWDTNWSYDSTLSHQFGSTGNYSVKVEVRDSANNTANCTVQVEVTEVIPEFPVFVIPLTVLGVLLTVASTAFLGSRRMRRGDG